MAADPGGTLWFESGAAGEGLFAQVSSTASVPVLRTGVAYLGSTDGGAAKPGSNGRASASLLAPNRRGGLLLAVPTAVVEYSENFVTVAGAIPLAGNDPVGQQGGDGGPLRATGFNRIVAIASDLTGNVYVADEADDDSGELTIRFLNRSNGPRSFYAGTRAERTVAAGTAGTIATTDGILPKRMIPQAPGLAVAGDRLYLATALAGSGPSSVVRMLNLGDRELSLHGVKVAPGHMAEVTTVAGADGGGAPPVPALAGIAADEVGNLFLAEPGNHRVRRLNPSGAVTTFAGTGAAGFDGNDRRATAARLDRPYDVEVGPGGRIYISDAGNAQVRVVDQDGTIRTALGNGTTSRWLCREDGTGGLARGEPALPTRTGTPKSTAVDVAGNLYVATAALAQVHRLTPSAALQPVAGRPSCDDAAGCPAGDLAAPREASMGGVSALKVAPAGGLYVMEERRIRFLNQTARPVTAHGMVIPAGAMRTVAGEPPPEGTVPPATPSPTAAAQTIPPIPSGPPPTTPDGQPAVRDAPGVLYTALAADSKGNLLLGDSPLGPFYAGNGSLRLVDPRGIITTLVDRPGLGPGGTVDPTRCCAYPGGLVTDTAGNVYISDTTGRRVWFLNRSSTPVVVHGVSVAGGRLVPVAGAGETGSQDEGIRALEARLSAPMGLALDDKGNLYVADFLAHGVRRVDVGGMITTVAGNGQPGFNGDGLKGQLTALDQPTDVVIDRCGNLLVADSGNDRVRRLNLVASCPTLTRAATTGGSRPLPYVTTGVVAAVAVVTSMFLSRRRRRRTTSTLAEAGLDGG